MNAEPRGPLSIWFCPTCNIGMGEADIRAGKCIASPIRPDCLVVRSHEMARAAQPPFPWQSILLTGLCGGLVAAAGVRLLFWWWPL